MASVLTPDNHVSVLSAEQYLPYSYRGDSPEELVQWQSSFRPVFKRILGLDRIAARGICDLEPRQISEEVLADHIREEWTVQTEPGFRVPFYLLRPKNASGRLPVVVTPHGHSRDGKRTYVGIDEKNRWATVEGERDVALQAVRAGYIALAPDMRGFAGLRRREEIEAGALSSCLPLQLDALLFGRTLNGERVWDLIRLVDYLETRADADCAKIVITGNSTGGMLSIYTAAVDERIAVSVPSCAGAMYAETRGKNSCPCMYIPGLLTLAETPDIAGLIAPRPIMIVAGDDDPIVPIDSVKSSFARLRAIYEQVGAGHLCRLSVQRGGHRYYKAAVWPFVREVLGR